MSEQSIDLTKRDINETIPFEEIPIGNVYVSNSSPNSICLKVSGGQVVILRDDSGCQRFNWSDKPCDARKILGKLVGLTVNSE